MRVSIGKFSRAGIEAGFGPDVSAGAEAALRDYALRLESSESPPGLPPFAPEAAEADAAVLELDLAVPPEVEESLIGEARERGVPVERIVAHAIYVFLADRDAAAGEGSEQAQEDPAARRYLDDALPTSKESEPSGRGASPRGHRSLPRGLWDRGRSGGGPGRR